MSATPVGIDPRAARSRERLLGTMTAMLDEGIDLTKASVTAIVARAGVTRPTFYQHFADVSALARTAALQRLDAILPRDQMDAAISEMDSVADASATEIIRLVVGDLLAHVSSHDSFYRSLFESPSAFEVYREVVQLVQDRIMLHSPLGSRIREAAGAHHDDMSSLLASGLVWQVIEWVRSNLDRATVPDMTARLTDLIAQVAISTNTRDGCRMTEANDSGSGTFD